MCTVPWSLATQISDESLLKLILQHIASSQISVRISSLLQLKLSNTAQDYLTRLSMQGACQVRTWQWQPEYEVVRIGLHSRPFLAATDKSIEKGNGHEVYTSKM